jgi:hypothetical protein
MAFPHESGKDIWMVDHGFSPEPGLADTWPVRRECHRHRKRRRSRAPAHQYPLRLFARTPPPCHRAAPARHC